MAVLPTGIGPVTGYNIERSLRFNSADSAYLNRTPASAGNRKTWTWSGWVKRSALGSVQGLLKAGPSAYVYLYFNSNDTLYFDVNTGSVQGIKNTSAVYRDISAWYHIVAACDTTQATALNRMRLYVNGSEITAWTTNSVAFSQNYDTEVNNTTAHNLGTNVSGTQQFNGYLTEVNFIDGQALTPSSFGETDSATGVWKPKKYTGTYGTNGFFLKFADNSGTTSTTLGKDSSGNGNNWTPNNFSVTAGVGNDSMVDTPTPYGSDTGAGGEVRGNYATMNPLTPVTGVSLSDGNLRHTGNAGATSRFNSTLGVSNGKWYAEVTITTTAGASNENMVGVVKSTATLTNFAGADANGYGYFGFNGNKYNAGASAYGASYTTGDIIGIALDLDAGTIVFYKNGVSQGTAFTGLSGEFFFTVSQTSTTVSGTYYYNFGQRPFAYTAPSGFKALCTQNLPTPTIGATSTTQANKYFDINLWTGTGASRSITNSGAMQPDLVWTKDRGVGTSSHGLFDSVRGNTKVLSSNSTVAEGTVTDEVTSFNSDGFSLGVSSNGYTNFNGRSFVGWQWNAGGSNATNTSGTITSTVSANTTSGFSIVTYTGTGANATVGHGLGVAPSMVITKRRDVADGWVTYHTSLTSGAYILSLQSTNAQTSAPTVYNSMTTRNSTVYSIGTDTSTNTNNKTYVAYCFAAVAGYSKFGSYTGNGSTDGPFVYLGFRPRYILFKNTTGGASAGVGNWVVIDTARDSYNVSSQYLYPNLSNAEGTAGIVDITSNGFKLRASGSSYNESSATHIFAAFAESPFKYSLAR